MNDLTQNDLSLTIERHLKAPVETIYNAWLKPDLLAQFISTCKGFEVTKAETDPRVGGRFLLLMHNGTKEVPHTGTYLDLQPHSRIVFTWESEHSTAENSTVTLDMRPEGGGTHLTLTHVRFANESSRDGHAGGWATILDGLAKTYG